MGADEVISEDGSAENLLSERQQLALDWAASAREAWTAVMAETPDPDEYDQAEAMIDWYETAAAVIETSNDELANNLNYGSAAELIAVFASSQEYALNSLSSSDNRQA